PSSGAVPLSVQLDGMLSQVAADATPLMFRWELGDGSPLLSAASPAHSYLLPGGYRARLTVYDAFGAKGEADELIRVARANGDVPPSARIRASSTRGIDELQVELACDCQAGSAPIAAYSWQLGNGQTESGDKTRALYGAGAHEVLLTVIDTAGLSATDRVQISVSRGDLLPPQCSATADALAGAAPFTTTWKGHALAGSGAVTKVEWDLEGEVSSGFAVSRKYDVPGAHWGRFRVEDNNGLACESVAWIVATAAGRTPPQIVSTPPSVSLVCSKPYVYQPVAVGEGPREWSLSDAPDGMVVDAATGEVRWPSATAAGLGAHSVTLVVRGPSGEAVQQFSVERSCDTSSVFTGCGCRSSAGVMPFGLAALALLLARTRGSRER
ncbi:MAG: PKD domain-containing protein, partial [Myxococcaceae bacterium]